MFEDETAYASNELIARILYCIVRRAVFDLFLRRIDKKFKISHDLSFAVSAQVRVQLLRGKSSYASSAGTQRDPQWRLHERKLFRQFTEGRKQDDR